MNPTMLLAVACGGAIGSVLRYITGIGIGKLAAGFPYATLTVNIIGSLLIGILAELSALRWDMSLEMRAFLMVGLLGGFTTFSAFTFDSMLLLQRGQTGAAVFYIAGSVLLSMLAFALGIGAIRHFI